MEFQFKTTPLAHQKEIFEHTKTLKYWPYLADMGTGKTKILLDVVGFLYTQRKIKALLVFGNGGSYENWVPEIEKHLHESIPRHVALWSSSMNKKEELAFNKAISTDKPGLKILVMNIEALSHKRSFMVAYEFAKNHLTMGVIDESTTIKNPKSKRSIAAMKIRDACIARRIMTGSALDNRPLDIWMQCEFLFPGYLGYRSFFAFKSAFCKLVKVRVPDNRKNAKKRSEDGRRPVQMIKGYTNLHVLRDILAKKSTIIKKEDCLDLPPKIYSTYYVDLTKEQKEYYEDMKKRSLIELSQEKIISAPIVLTKLLKLQQIVCGFIKTDDGEIVSIPSKRIEALHEILDESRDKGIIWTPHRKSIEDIAKSLADKYGKESVRTYYGDTTKEERDEIRKQAIRGAQTSIDWLVSNQVSGGYGNTWTNFNLSVYYANSFDGELRNQSEDRMHRIGQTAKVLYVDIVAKGTIDEKLIKTIRDKKDIAKMLTPSNWREWF